MNQTEIPELNIPSNHCKHCPTAQAIKYGYDPESFDILTNESWVRSLNQSGLDVRIPEKRKAYTISRDLTNQVLDEIADRMRPIALPPIEPSSF